MSDSSRSNRSVTARGSTPGSSSVPLMVCVLPEPVLPYAKTVVVKPGGGGGIEERDGSQRLRPNC